VACGTDGEPTGLFYNNTAHPTVFYGRDLFSADVPGAARAHLGEEPGDIPVPFLNAPLL